VIPYLDLKAQYRTIRDEVEPAVCAVLESGQYVLGPEVEAFEQEFAEFCAVRHCVAVSSGTSALQMALMAAGVGSDDEVITVPMTFVATTAAIRYLGAKPVFVDISPGTWTMDVNQLERALSKRTKAILPVHLYGLMADMKPIREFADAHKLALIEDAAQAHGAEYHGKRAGGHGNLACFSFYPGKNLGACGEGGAVVTDSDAHAATIRKLRDWGQAGRHRYELKGFNYRLDALQAAILRVKLRHLDDWTQARRRHALAYARGLSQTGLTLPHEPRDYRSVYHVYAVMVEERAAIQQALGECGIGTGVHYPVPVHLTEAHSDLGHVQGDFPVAERVAREELSLPMFAELSEEQIAEVCESLCAAVTSTA
jgi:dTDP-4-amino-4,6-dideoxygalactose transaminase